MKRNREYDICVIGGLGHVGLPLAISFADAGKKVIVYDINEKTIEKVSSGEMPFLETGAEPVLRRVLNNNLFISSNKNVISKSSIVITIIGTPVDRHLNPEFTLFRTFIDEVVDELDDDQHLILRSTVYPGTTNKIRNYLHSKGKKLRVSFCPERIAQGKAMEELKTLPQIVSSFDDESVKEAESLFRLFTDDIIILEPLEAELAKLFTNVWRYIQFATSNQFYQIALQNNVDFYRIHEAVTYKYPRASGFPKAGLAAGPCLFKDTMQLAAYSNNTFFLGHAAMLINEGVPNVLIQSLKNQCTLSEKTVGILGMAFKANNDDKRESLSYKLKKLLEIEADRVLCTDVYINEEEFVTPQTLVKESDIIIVATPHSEYTGLEIPGDKILVDIWNFFGREGILSPASMNC
jgi:UDP-N-acetyl-D-mannosaminuronic acid dehydrogenase